MIALWQDSARVKIGAAKWLRLEISVYGRFSAGRYIYITSEIYQLAIFYALNT